MKLAVIVPTVDGRQDHLARCVQAYSERSPGATVRFFVEANHETCGLAWNAGADRATEWGADFLHFTADDIMPGTKWLAACVRAVENGNVPAGLVAWHELQFVIDPETGLPWVDDRLPEGTGGYNRYFENDSTPADGSLIDDTMIGHFRYASVPFCSAEQWAKIGPSIATHYGTDKWLTCMAQENGYGLEVCRDALFYHTPTITGRAWQRFPGWLDVDLFSFDADVAFPLHWEGSLYPSDPHPNRGTLLGREEARAWRIANVPDEEVRPWHRLLPGEGDEFLGEPSEELIAEARRLRELRMLRPELREESK